MNRQPRPSDDDDQQNSAEYRDELDDDLGRFFTLAELAALLRVPPATLRYWQQKHSGPDWYKVGRHIRYRRRDVDDWLDRQRNPAG